MGLKKERKKTYYVSTCEICGKEFEVSKDSIEKTCYACKTDKAIKKAKEDLSSFIDAKIKNMEPEHFGHCTSSDMINSIEIETIEGKHIILTAGGYDERYIEWREK